MARRNPAARKQKQAIDFEDEDVVRAEMGAALDIDPDDLTIKTSDWPQSSSTVYKIKIRGGGTHGKEWTVVESEEQANDIALGMVREMLEQEPENFVRSFIEQHIDEKKLRDELMSDVASARFDDADDLANRRPDEFWDAYEHAGFTAPEEDEDGDRPEPTNAQIDELAMRQAESELQDPMQYLEDIYGKEDAVKQAIAIAGVDVDAAAEEAVNVDGAGHFLSSWDGATYETPNGLVYWRDN